MTGLTSVPALYVPSVPSNTLFVDGHEDDLHETDRAAIRNLILEAWGLPLPLVINGNFDHFQRVTAAAQTSTTTYSSNTSYAADRLYVLPAGASITQQRSTTVPNARSRYSLQVNGAASVTTVDIGQRIEAAIVNTRAAQSLVFSCYVRNESGAAFTPNLRIGTPGAADDFTTVTNRLDQALQSCADSAWTRVYHVFNPTAYTNLANGLDVALRVPSGSLVAADIVRVAQFDLRPGAALATYLPPDPATELLRALRYACVQTGDTLVLEGAVQSSGSTIDAPVFWLPVPMRASPSFTHDATAIGSGTTEARVYNYALSADATASSLSLTQIRVTPRLSVMRFGNVTNGSTANLCQFVVGSAVKLFWLAEL